MTHAAGVLLVAGAAVFVAVAFAPASFVFGMSDPDEQRRFLDAHARSWKWAQLPFAAGAVVSAVGLLVLGLQLDGARGLIVALAGAVAIVASLPWAEHCRLRARSRDDFLQGRLPGWHFTVYVWGMLGALGATGIALFGTDLPRWSAWFVVGATGVFAAVMLRLRDLPPFVFYLVTGVLGVTAL